MSESVSVDEINFFDPETNDCPYHAYTAMRDEAPVWQDPHTGMYFVTRFEDVRAILANTEVYTNRTGSAAGNTEKAVRPTDPEEIRKQEEAAAQEREIQALYEEKGWVPVGTLDARDGEDHAQLRRVFNDAFRPRRIKELDPYVENLAYKLLDEILAKGARTDWVADFAIPLPLYTIGKQMGVPEGDMPMIKKWTDAWVQRLGLMQTMDERRWSAEQEIEGQQYFQKIFDRLREHPEDTVLSDLVNVPIPEWGRPLNDNELHSEMFADIFVGGSETTTNALSAGVKELIEHPELWEALKADPEGTLPTFVEEVVRIEGPVQGLLREVAEDVELHGVKIPAGSVVHVRFAAGNRDPRQYERAGEIVLDRAGPRTHLGYGFGVHFCLGAPLARRELYWSFKALVDRVESMRFVPDANDFAYAPNYFLRGLKQLHVELTPKA